MEPTREDLAYAAGLVDGEGSIGIGRRKPRPYNGNRSPQHALTVAVVNSHLPVLEWLQYTFGGSVHERPLSERLGTKTTYVWKVGGNRKAAAFLQAIRPWSKIKTIQCWLGLEFAAQTQSYLNVGRSRYVPIEELALRDGFYWAMREANA